MQKTMFAIASVVKHTRGCYFTPVQLRDYQKSVLTHMLQSDEADLIYMPTGAGKSVLSTEYIRQKDVQTVVIVHRKELVTNMSATFGKFRIPHRLIASNSTVNDAVKIHLQRFNRSYINPTSKFAIASVDTLIRRKDEWLDDVELYLVDEGHHMLKDNKWGKCVSRCPGAKIVGVSATPHRGDKQPLGKPTGLYDNLIVGPSVRELIQRGHLCDWRAAIPGPSIDLTGVKISKATGDYNHADLIKKAEKSRIVGDVVDHWLKLSKDRLTMVFATDVKTAHKLAGEFNQHGISAVALDGGTPPAKRFNTMEKFLRREVMVIVNVGIFIEGVDVPLLETVVMASPTASQAVYLQQFGRGLRTHPDKDHLLVIDHADNIKRHGVPDPVIPPRWTLRGTKNPSPPTLMKTCDNCALAYPRGLTECPYCGHQVAKSEPKPRTVPEVQGDLTLLDSTALDELRRAQVDVSQEGVNKQVSTWKRQGLSGPRLGKNIRDLNMLVDKQQKLRDAIDNWGSPRYDTGITESDILTEFYQTFKIDLLSAKGLRDKRRIEELTCLIQSQMM